MSKNREALINKCVANNIIDEECWRFFYLPHEEKSNVDIFTDFCKRHSGYLALLLSDDEICDNKELVILAKKYGFFSDYQLISERLLNDSDVALALADCNKYEYTKINKKLRDDVELMLKAIKINPNIYCSLPVHVKIDRRVLIEIAKNAPYELFGLEKIKKEYRERIRNDKELALIVACRDASSLKFFSDKLLRDCDVLKAAFSIDEPKEFKTKILKNIWAIRYIDTSFWASDDKLIMLALKEDGNLLKIIPEKYRSEKKFVLVALDNTPYAIQYCSKDLLDDEEVILKALQEDTEEILSFASERLRSNYKVVYKAVGIDSLNLQYASDELKDNRDIVLRAIKNYGGVLEDASIRLQEDPELIKIAKKNM